MICSALFQYLPKCKTKTEKLKSLEKLWVPCYSKKMNNRINYSSDQFPISIYLYITHLPLY